MKRTWLRWLVFGLTGIAFALGIGIAAAKISSERIGLSSEPLSAGEDLAPSSPASRDQPRTTPTPEPNPKPKPEPIPVPTPTPAPEDSSSAPGSGHEEESEEEPGEVEPDHDD